MAWRTAWCASSPQPARVTLAARRLAWRVFAIMVESVRVTKKRRGDENTRRPVAPCSGRAVVLHHEVVGRLAGVEAVFAFGDLDLGGKAELRVRRQRAVEIAFAGERGHAGGRGGRERYEGQGD